MNDSGKIVYGDTLRDIAMKNKCTVGEIVGLNDIKIQITYPLEQAENPSEIISH